MSGYQRINFKDQNVERPKTYDVTNNPDGSITLIESFGNVEELGTPINQENMNHLEDGIDAVSFSKFSLDLTYKKNDLVTDIQDDELKIFKSLKDNNFGHLPSENDYWEEVEIAGGGGGLEIGDIGIAPLGIDETQGKRRYLNGQIIVQDQYAVFSEKVKNAITQYPTLGCTEQEWQTTATMSVGGQVGKFVVDNEGGTIRLPKIIMPIQGLTDLSKLAEIVEAGLPNIEGTFRNHGGGDLTATGSFYVVSDGGGWVHAGTDGKSATFGFNASLANPIYGNSDTVQQEQIQYPYFIQVATGAETEDNIINTLELNNPFVLLEPKFFESEVYNISWLLANGSYNGSNAVHPSAYQALLVENNAEVAIGSTVTLPIGTEYTKRGLSVKLSTDSDITDYDFVVNASDETFRLPIKVNLASGKSVVGNGMAMGVTDGTHLASLYQASYLSTIVTGYGATVPNKTTAVTDPIPVDTTVGVTTDPTKSGIETSDANLYLYFYVGETVQNANLVNVGRIEEKLSSFLTRNNKEEIISWGMPDYSAGVSKTNKQVYQAEVDGYLSAYGSGNSSNNTYEISISTDGVNFTTISRSYHSTNVGVDIGAGIAPIAKGIYYKATISTRQDDNTYHITFYPLKGAK